MEIKEDVINNGRLGVLKSQETSPTRRITACQEDNEKRKPLENGNSFSTSIISYRKISFLFIAIISLLCQ